MTLFKECFEQLEEKNGIENTEWRTKNEQSLDGEQKDTVLKCLTIKSYEGEQVTVVKSFNIPVDFPFEKKEGDRRKSCEIIHLAPSTVNFCLRRPKPFL